MLGIYEHAQAYIAVFMYARDTLAAVSLERRIVEPAVDLTRRKDVIVNSQGHLRHWHTVRRCRLKQHGVMKSLRLQ